ncbi:DUF859 family phage minor structural protein [uncultured Thomasclavelia sp.]|uniref:DUF859 family phage minor structural protein n=1 Tax=uncultured Thomasclavelia sp. TaxID=3025759 RepID=UPI002601AE49|nr:DUF859 family phage minor structural protein [uncultured Thomasclavelia sp.]
MAYGTSNKYIVYSINTQQVTNDINTNATWLKVWIDIWRTNSGYSTYGTGTVYCRINGGLYSAGISTSQRITSTPIRIGEWDVTIPHQPDGTASISITAWFSHSQFSSSEQGFVLTLNTIPRAANITGFTCSTNYLDGTMSVSYDSKANFSYKLRLSIPNVVRIYLGDLGTQSAGSKSTTYTFTQTELETIYEQTKNSATQQIGAVIETYNGGSKVGESSELIITLTIPTSIVPTFTNVTRVGVNLFNQKYLKNISSIKFTVNGASGVYGSTISSYKISGAYSASGTSNTFTTGTFGTAGTKSFIITVTDSRGRSASETVNILFYDYEPPSLIMDCYRCREDGTRDDINGTYLYIKPTYSYTDDPDIGNSITNRKVVINNITQTGAVFTNFASGQVIITGTYALNLAFDVIVTVTDGVGNSSEARATIKVSAKPFNIKANKKGAAFGIYSTKDNTLEVGWDLQVDGDTNIQGTLKATGNIYGGAEQNRRVAFYDEVEEKINLETIYTIFGSVVAHPNDDGCNLLSWTSIQNRFYNKYGISITEQTKVHAIISNGDAGANATHIDGVSWQGGDSSKNLATNLWAIFDTHTSNPIRINFVLIYIDGEEEVFE